MKNNFCELKNINNNNSIFKKIKSFIKNIFNRSQKLLQQEGDIKQNVEKNNNFLESIRISTSYDEIFALQRKLKNGELTIEDLTEKQKDELIGLYEKQIQDKKNKLKNIKAKLNLVNN